MLLSKSKTALCKFILFLSFLWFSTTALSQDNKLVWYITSDPQGTKSDIELTLKSIKHLDAKQRFFTESICLSTAKQTKEEGSALRQQLNWYSETGVFLRDQNSALNQQLFSSLLGFNYYLRVTVFTDPLVKTITLELYQAIPGEMFTSQEGILPELDVVNKKIDKASFPAATTDPDLIQNAIGDALRRIIPELNEAPEALIRVNGQDTGFYYSVTGKPINLDASYSKDIDTKKEYFSYKWRQISLDNSYNVVDSLRVYFDERAESIDCFLPRPGTYRFGLTINDGSKTSREDTLTVIHFPAPKVHLDTRNLRNKRKVSFFQFLAPKNNSRKINRQAKVYIQSAAPLDYQLFFLPSKQDNNPPIQIQQEKLSSQQFQLHFNGKLRYEGTYRFALYGKSGHIYTDTMAYTIRLPRWSFSRLSLGWQPFFGPSLLCVDPPGGGDFWAVGPMSLTGGLYFFHTPQTFLLLEGGAIFFLRRKIADQVAAGLGLGKFVLKAGTDLGQSSHYLGLQLIGGLATNQHGELIQRRHYGLVFGTGVKNNLLDIDFLNVFYSPRERCWSLSWGIRLNGRLVDLFKQPKGR